ncbi:hypothetical protein [Chamaesiphon sp.]|uniref:hypothetical protein n=1 Tax=Chamaesiphon sp. TaxID=2814140 RepID=UPI003593AAEC
MIWMRSRSPQTLGDLAPIGDRELLFDSHLASIPKFTPEAQDRPKIFALPKLPSNEPLVHSDDPTSVQVKKL